jgi:hypothetical protein
MEEILIKLKNNFYKYNLVTGKYLAWASTSGHGSWFKCSEETKELLRQTIFSGMAGRVKKLPGGCKEYV